MSLPYGDVPNNSVDVSPSSLYAMDLEEVDLQVCTLCKSSSTHRNTSPLKYTYLHIRQHGINFNTPGRTPKFPPTTNPLPSRRRLQRPHLQSPMPCSHIRTIALLPPRLCRRPLSLRARPRRNICLPKLRPLPPLATLRGPPSPHPSPRSRRGNRRRNNNGAEPQRR